MPPKKAHRPKSIDLIPLHYRLFFLYIEPFFALAGAWYAYFQPEAYLHLTHAASFPLPSAPTSIFSSYTIAAADTHLPVGTRAALAQLANLYVLFALNEALVLRAAHGDLRVWRALLFVLLVADIGHLWSVRRTGTAWEVYVNVLGFNAMGWGNVAFVYLGALTRIAFLSGWGL